MNARQLFQLAESICKRQQITRQPNSAYYIAAVGVRPDGLIVSSYNITIARQRTPAGHAEYRLSSKLHKGSIVYVARLRVDGQRGIAKPCGSCANILKQRRVAKVYYTISNDEYGVLLF